MTVVEETCAPFQFALSTRAGTDCVGHAIRAATDADHEATVLSIDGVGTSIGARCCRNSWKFRVSNLCCHSCALCALSLHGTSGKMMRGTAKTLNSTKVESKAILLCL